MNELDREYFEVLWMNLRDSDLIPMVEAVMHFVDAYNMDIEDLPTQLNHAVKFELKQRGADRDVLPPYEI